MLSLFFNKSRTRLYLILSYPLITLIIFFSCLIIASSPLIASSPSKVMGPSIPHIWSLPAENFDFVGRDDLLKTMAFHFKNHPLKTVVLYGPSGFGKSQLAKHYAYNHYSLYDLVWWFKGGQYLESQFEDFALEVSSYFDLNLEEKIKTIGHSRLIHIIKDVIRKNNFKCLIIFDNAQIYQDIEPYIPFSHNKGVHVIVTTKNANFSNNGIQVKPLHRKESLLYIHRFLPLEDKNEKNKLADYFGDCPVFLAHAVNYIMNYPGMTIQAYLDKYTSETLSPLATMETIQQLGGLMDGYTTDPRMAIKLNLDELKRNSLEAFELISFLSVLSPAEVSLVDIQKWLEIRKIKTDIIALLNFLNKDSFIETTTDKSAKKAYISMHELRQKIISLSIGVQEKKKLIDEGIEVLKPWFSGRSDKIVETILKTPTPLFHVLKLSEEADRINYHTPDLTSLRIRAFDVFLCGMRDQNKAEVIHDHLKKDLQKQVNISLGDQILYNITLSVFYALHHLDYEKALEYGIHASHLLQNEPTLYEEKIRLNANLIQYLSLTGELDKCELLVKEGERLLLLSKSEAYNTLFIYAVSIYLGEKGHSQKVIDLITNNKNLFERLNFYPSMRFYILAELAEAFLKQGNIEECQKTLEKVEQDALEFYTDTNNTFFTDLNVLKAALELLKPHKFETLENSLKGALKAYEDIIQASNGYRKQAFAHLILAKFYHLHKKYKEAKKNYFISERIFEKVLKNKKIDDMSELYKSLAFLGADLQDESLIHHYFKKQLMTFGLTHPKTKDISLYLDAKKIAIPF